MIHAFDRSIISAGSPARRGFLRAVVEPSVESGDPFAHEIDHMSCCVLDDIRPHAPGEEGLQDMRIV